MAESVGGNDDLLNLILLCLPARSLHRFKSVSKHWLAFISDPNFMLVHFSFRQLSTSWLYVRRLDSFSSPCADSRFGFISLSEDGPPEVPPPFTTKQHPHPYSLDIRQSCNGLLLCSSLAEDYRHTSNAFLLYDYHVYNPTSNKFTTIPTVPSIPFESPTLFSCHVLAFDPVRSPHYKIVYAANSVSARLKYRIAIYSSETRRWKLLKNSFRADYDSQFFHEAIYSQGGIHWMTVIRCANAKAGYKYFNIEEERIGTIPKFPTNKNLDEKNSRNYFIKEWRDHLYLVDMYYPPGLTFYVYELDMKDYSEWFFKYQVDVDPVVRSIDPLCREDPIVFPLLIVGGDKDDQSANYMVLQVGNNTILKYNFADNTFKKIPISLLELNLPLQFMYGHLYFESFYSV